ncbi:hypothetical protein HID58_074188, partial [Brassica napus]
MVLEAEKTEKLVRRRTRSRGEKQKHPSPTKDQRYPGSSARLLKKFKYSADSLHVISDSDAGEAGSSMDSSAEGSSPVEPQGGDVGSLALKFPSRLFTANSYPTALHLNIYWKANVIGAVAACLQGGCMLKDEKPGGGTVHRRNLHPRKPVVVICNDESSSGDGGPEGPPQTGGHLGVPKATISKSRKRKPNEDNHGQSESQISGDGNDASEVATKGDTPTLFEREKCFENEYHNTRSPPFDENIADEVKFVTLVLLL